MSVVMLFSLGCERPTLRQTQKGFPSASCGRCLKMNFFKVPIPNESQRKTL